PARRGQAAGTEGGGAGARQRPGGRRRVELRPYVPEGSTMVHALTFSVASRERERPERATNPGRSRHRLAIVVLLMMTCPISAQPALPRVLKDVAFDQKLDAQVPLDLTFRDEAGRDVRLGEYFDGKPVILVLAYYRCPGLCNQVLNGLVRAMLDLPFDA